jgi:hypothetical protein
MRLRKPRLAGMFKAPLANHPNYQVLLDFKTRRGTNFPKPRRKRK